VGGTIVTAERDRESAAWLRAQIDDLQSHAALSAEPMSRAEIVCALRAIWSGNSWRLWLARRREADAQLARTLRGW
jgi:hypothetical protein